MQVTEAKLSEVEANYDIVVVDCPPELVATVNRDLSCLRQILGIAVKEELIQKSPFFGGRVEFLHEKGRERTLSFDEERKYLKAATPLLRDVGIIIVEMGLRPGEIFAASTRYRSQAAVLQAREESCKGSVHGGTLRC